LKRFQTIVAVAASLAVLAVIYYGEYHRRAYQQERAFDESPGRLGLGVDCHGRDGNEIQAIPTLDATRVPKARPVVPQAPASSPGAVSRFRAQAHAPARGGTVSVGTAERRLLDAVRQVESGGNDRAIGDCGTAHGPLQIHLGAWLDGGGKAVDYPRLAYSVEASERIAINYWARYGAVTDEARARTWNGGPNGMNKAATLPYWRKVQAAKGEKR